MEIYPAIDIRGGCCVRLRQGDYDRETVFDADPLAVAQRWVQQGARWLHLVDLDGAREGRPVNLEVIRRIVAESSVPTQVGGGIREWEHIDAILNLGVQRVVLGTRAIREPTWLRQACERHPGRIVLSLDAHGTRLATHGWQQSAERQVFDVLRESAGLPLAGFVYTDIQRDGMLTGPNFDVLADLRNATSLPVIASGGIATLDDLRRLAGLRLAGCIIGRALYEGRFDLTQALLATQSSSREFVT